MKIFPEERQNMIAGYVNENGKATIHELSRQFEISIPTVRRDLAELEQKGFLHRSHGGAVARDRVLEEISFEKRMKRNYSEKVRIARAASAFIKEGDVVILDTGTTNFCIAQQLKEKKNITVITNSFKTAMELASNRSIKHVLLGGHLNPETFAVSGSVTVEGLKRYNADVAFIGVTGIHHEKGLTDIYEDESPVKRAFIEISKKKIVVASRSKFGMVSFSATAKLSEVDMVIGSAEVDLETRKVFEDTGPEYLYV